MKVVIFLLEWLNIHAPHLLFGLRHQKFNSQSLFEQKIIKFLKILDVYLFQQDIIFLFGVFRINIALASMNR